LSDAINTRSKQLFSTSKEKIAAPDIVNSNVSFPTGLYKEGDKLMWQGLPVPRIEQLHGNEYFVTLDNTSKFINIINNKNMDGYIEIINPKSLTLIGKNPIPTSEKLRLITEYHRDLPLFNVTGDSFFLKKSIQEASLGNISIEDTNVNEDTLPKWDLFTPNSKGKNRVEDLFDDIPIGPEIVDVDNLSSGSITPRQNDFNSHWSDFS
jgi:hypothetical protein